MRHLNWQRNPDLLAAINVLAVVSMLGFLYCINALLYDFTNFSRESLLIYSVWFLVSIVSLYLMKHQDGWGAYVISVATILVGLYEILHGTASVGGAILAAWVLLLALFYLSNAGSDGNSRLHEPS